MPVSHLRAIPKDTDQTGGERHWGPPQLFPLGEKQRKRSQPSRDSPKPPFSPLLPNTPTNGPRLVPPCPHRLSPAALAVCLVQPLPDISAPRGTTKGREEREP